MHLWVVLKIEHSGMGTLRKARNSCWSGRWGLQQLCLAKLLLKLEDTLE
jgi:hypothetical protein